MGNCWALDLAVYALAGLYILRTFISPSLYTDLARLYGQIKAGGLPPAPVQRARGMRHPGF